MRGRQALTVGVIAAVTAALAGCQDDEPFASGTPDTSTTTTSPAAPTPRVDVSLPDGATQVKPGSVVSVGVVNGLLTAVTVTSSDSKESVAGRFGEGGRWASTGRLLPGRSYRVAATLRDGAGRETTQTSSFTTVTPQQVVGYTVTPDGWTVGAGMPVQVRFDADIDSPAAKAEIEKRLATAVSPAQPGAWGWTSDRTLMFRPRAYWQAGTKITVKAPLAGLEVAPGAYITEDNGATLSIGVQRIMRVDLATHTMTYSENGALLRTFPISGGRPGERFETRSGTKLVLDKSADIVMDSSTFGIDKADPEYYRTKVKWAVRITDSGEFLHSAPWSVEQQGRANVSHGCINLAPADAEWVFHRVIPGDVVENVNSAYRLQPHEAGVPVWLWNWAQWQGKSALAKVKAH